MDVALINERTQRLVATYVEVAETRHARRKGLLGRQVMPADAALVITPCISVHTAFMRFPIDVVFVDRDGRAVQMIHNMQPWRMAASLKAHAVIEMAAGRTKDCGIQLGDRLYLVPETVGPRRAGPSDLPRTPAP